VSHLRRVQELLPAPLTAQPDSTLLSLLNVFALEMDAADEDIERVRRSHWIETAETLEDAGKIGALLNIEPLPDEELALYRQRLLALARALLDGGTGPGEIRRFVWEYLTGAERAFGATLVPGLVRTVRFEDGYRTPEDRPNFQPLALVENPVRRRIGLTLAARGGRVPYLYRWVERNGGLDESVVELDVDGLFGDVTVNPILVNQTTGDLIGFRGVVKFGRTLRIRFTEGEDPAERRAAAELNGGDVTASLFSMEGFRPGVPFSPEDLDEQPRLPRLARGDNDWIFLSVAFFDLPGLNRTFYSIAGPALREAVFNETAFDEAVFPSGDKARVRMLWDETEPASFEVRVPWFLNAEARAPEERRLSLRVRDGLLHDLRRLHAAGVKARALFEPSRERQAMRERFRLGAKALPPETGPAGREEDFGVGGRFDESPLDRSRFEPGGE